MRRLESEIAQLRQPSVDSQRVVTHAEQPTTPLSAGTPEQTAQDRLIENSTTEHFVRRLQGVYSNRDQGSGDSRFPATSTPDGTAFRQNDIQSTASKYTYIPLEDDNNRT